MAACFHVLKSPQYETNGPTLMKTGDSSETSVNVVLHGVTSPKRVTFNPAINHRSVCDATLRIQASLLLCCFECVFFVFNLRHSLFWSSRQKASSLTVHEIWRWITFAIWRQWVPTAQISVYSGHLLQMVK